MLRIKIVNDMITPLIVEFKKMREISKSQPNELLYQQLLSISIKSLKDLRQFIYESGCSKIIK
ncbi:MAG: hypothetical protein MR904_04340 [Clostridia bacterium]|nr:hypothetical protein [Clostridia bacterium]